MSKTFRINLDVEFTNGETLTVEREAQGTTIVEANTNVHMDLTFRFGNLLAKVHPINSYEQIDPVGTGNEAKPPRSTSPAQRNRRRADAAPRSATPTATRPSSPTEIFLNEHLIAIRTETHVLLTDMVKQLGHYVPKEHFTLGFARFNSSGAEKDIHDIMMGLQKDCFEYLKQHQSDQFSVYDGERQQMQTISLSHVLKSKEEGMSLFDVEGIEPPAGDAGMLAPTLGEKKVAFLCNLLLHDLNHLVAEIEAKGLDIDLADQSSMKGPSHEEQILASMLECYRGFVTESAGTPYFDAWVNHQRDKEIDSLL